MYNNKRFIAIIPARGGSKGLPGKNIKNMCGKPLIAWSIDAALNSQYLDEILVSTDDPKIAEVAKKYGATVPFLRPDKLATDEATTYDAVAHALDFYRNHLDKEYDYIVLLEPTSPLREQADIDTMIEVISSRDEHFDSIVSIGEVHEHPSIMKKTVGDMTVPYCEELVSTSRRQDNPPAYFPYGVAYIVKTLKFLKEKTFYPKRTTYYQVKRYQCYEIDDIYDFLAIENIMKHEWSVE
jgi:CMP-N-acetylneuraminic acid synthetase